MFAVVDSFALLFFCYSSIYFIVFLVVMSFLARGSAIACTVLVDIMSTAAELYKI